MYGACELVICGSVQDTKLMGGCSIMGQLTISRFRGDTTFGLVTRIGSTLFGGIVGLVVWYVLLSCFHLPSRFFKWQH
jgi:hypothetical protein